MTTHAATQRADEIVLAAAARKRLPPVDDPCGNHELLERDHEENRGICPESS
jgi:hypothetical protein